MSNQGSSSSSSFRWKTIATVLAVAFLAVLPVLASSFNNFNINSLFSSLFLSGFDFNFLSADTHVDPHDKRDGDNTVVPDIVAIQSEILGTWHLDSYSLLIHFPGPLAWPTWTRHPFGVNATGLLLYTADGYMSAQLMQPGTPLFASEAYHLASDTEMARAARGYLAYAGAYSVGLAVDPTGDGDRYRPVVNHSVQVSLFPNWLGTTQTRIVELEGDRLTLMPDPEGLPSWKVSINLKLSE
ncbi:hypothetical protein VTN77DRAFT_2755 [Rasamsonia byssochlamydoides]|uniref:uncharacterized protein n=1 Tax=Rasamsonia byssochlamydoides TaxID=89139 RepID=UPI00374408B7